MKIEGLYNRDSASSWEAYSDYKLNKEMNAQKGAGALTAGNTAESEETKRVADSTGCSTSQNSSDKERPKQDTAPKQQSSGFYMKG